MEKLESIEEKCLSYSKKHWQVEPWAFEYDTQFCRSYFISLN